MKSFVEGELPCLVTGDDGVSVVCLIFLFYAWFVSIWVDVGGGGRYPAGMEWSENLPTDAAVVMKLFVCCSDGLMPKQWETDRPFARQHLVDRQPLKSDAEPGRYE